MKNKPIAPPTYHISLAYDLLKSALQSRLKSNGLSITPEQLAVLRLLHQQDCVSIKFISENTFRDSSTVTRIIDNLEKNKLLGRIASKSDRRVKNICISKLGEEVYTMGDAIAKEHVSNAMDGISTSDIDSLINTLNQIQNNLKKQKERQIK